jgi:hypothetical protein
VDAVDEQFITHYLDDEDEAYFFPSENEVKPTVSNIK